ncbi:MAG: hypothetical protein KDC46_09365 [Thermoleophilia bacterium]|nr:hypothetical protein [Thermoleophilia bacterium]
MTQEPANTWIDFYDGVDGPTLLIKALDARGAFALLDAIDAVRNGHDGFEVESLPGVRPVGAESLTLYVRDQDSCSIGKLKHRAAFWWACSNGGWEHVSLLVLPFAEGRSGHQYLNDGNSDVTIIFSCNEPEEGIWITDPSLEHGPDSPERFDDREA